jgi:hypothetical protein
LLSALLLTGCAAHLPQAATEPSDASSERLAPGVVHRAIPTADGEGIDLIDVDLTLAPIRIAVAAKKIGRSDGVIAGEAYTPHEWLDRQKAIAAVNGGYFGRDAGPGRKEIVGLLMQNGRVRRAAPPLLGSGSGGLHAGRYVRSAFAITTQGLPEIAWAATDARNPQSLQTFARSAATSDAGRRAGNIRAAVGCGPTLIHDGRIVMSARAERLSSPGPEARTFVAYDEAGGRPRHFVLGIASGTTYNGLAAFLKAYFPKYDDTGAEAAMCLDGGGSTQLSYRLPDGTVASPRETGVSVPDAVLLLPR